MINNIGIDRIGALNKGIGTIKNKETDISFKDMVKGQIEKVNAKQVESDEMTEAFLKGEIDDLHAVMIATEEARLSLDLALQVRNKVVEAYKEINSIQL